MRVGRPLLIVLLLVAGMVTALPTGPAFGETADEVRSALGISPGDFEAADFGGSDAAGHRVFSGALGRFPTQAPSFLILSTGAAADADSPDSEGSLSSELGGTNNDQGEDLVQLHLTLKPPPGAECVSFDFMFLSEEFPEFVGSGFNDRFTAEMVATDLSVVGDEVVAPYNFAYDTEGNVISVNSVFNMAAATGTTYDGGTPVLSARAPIETDLDGNLHLYFTIQDLGDSLYDSAVFIDNLIWLQTVDCTPGSTLRDTDGDALPDIWETEGVDVDGDGVIDLDLPAMGSNPLRKDIFIEIDHMESGIHTHRLKVLAQQMLIAAFDSAPVGGSGGVLPGITLHIDAGPDREMNPITHEVWGALSGSDSLDDGPCLVPKDANGDRDWSDFDDVKADHFDPYRADVFHYMIAGHNNCEFGGISRGIPAGDVLTAVPWGLNLMVNGGAVYQAVTVMHELGHNLGLHHGGGDDLNFKPNYLSVMNYSFSHSGLLVDGDWGTLDYSFVELDPLHETALDETAGLGPDGPITGYGTKRYCGDGEAGTLEENTASGPIDWDCSGGIDAAPVTSSVNWDWDSGLEKYYWKFSAQNDLYGFNDWANVRFDGGAIGGLNYLEEVPDITPDNEVPEEFFVENGLVLSDFVVGVAGPHHVLFAAGSRTHFVEYQIINFGEFDDVYDLDAVASTPVVDLSGVPASVSLTAGETFTLQFPVLVPLGTPEGYLGGLTLTATSTANPLIADDATTLIDALWIDIPIVGPSIRCNGLAATIIGDDGDNMLSGTPGDDVIWAGDGDDIVLGRGGNDVICGGAGDDIIRGGRGRDQIFGEAGADTLSGGKKNDRLHGGEGNDTLRGNRGRRDRLDGGPGVDDLNGGSGGHDRCTLGETYASCEVIV